MDAARALHSSGEMWIHWRVDKTKKEKLKKSSLDESEMNLPYVIIPE